jgi:DNA helicase-2/ATP-dependent DNA helicase PcrA
LLRQHASLIGYQPDFAICDTDDQKRVLRQVYKDLRLRAEDLPLERARSVISRSKNKNWSPEKYLAQALHFERDQLHAVFSAYQAYLLKSNCVDFDDLILLPVQLMRENRAVREYYGERFRYLLIDEYQDTNQPQYDLVKLLTCKHQNISAVGDEDQSIYGFRGADITNILRFESDFPGATLVKLEQNYRSTQNILSAATAVVSNNVNRKNKELWTKGPQGALLQLYRASNPRDEARWVVERIYKHLQEGETRIAVLYRTNFQSRQFEESLNRLELSYRLVGSLSFYQRKEVKDALAFLRLARNPDDDVSLGRILNEPPRSIGQVSRDRIRSLGTKQNCSMWEAIQSGLQGNLFPARTHQALTRFSQMVEKLRDYTRLPLYMALQKTLEETGYVGTLKKQDSEESTSRLLNLQELVSLAREHGEGESAYQDFLDHAALYAETDEYDPDAPVTLMTLHNAKGLEFPVVFLVGCEEGLFPHSRAVVDNDLEEERRLCYVGMTRAQKQLYLCYSQNRRFFGQEGHSITQPSRFLQELPPQLCTTVSPSGYRSTAYQGAVHLRGDRLQMPQDRRKQYEGQTYNSVDRVKQFLESRSGRPSGARFAAGARVLHSKYGTGRVLNVERTNDDLKITVQFPGIGIKKMLQRIAKLELV